jgi:hypothetical protein
MFLDAARRFNPGGNPLLLGNPVLDELDKPPAGEMPRFHALPEGIAVARTGSANTDLTVVLKNTETQFDSIGATVPSLGGHSHSDNGAVQAYRNGEPILIDPGYGDNGVQCKDRVPYFTNWNHHCVPMIEDPAGKGYPDDVKKQIGETGNFILMPRTKDDDKKTDAFEISGKNGKALCLRTDLGLLERFVIVPNADSILIVDRLKKAARMKLAWWGYGDPKDQTMTSTGGDVVYTRAKDSKTKIRSVLGGTPFATQTIQGRYGPDWGSADIFITGVHLTSNAPVLYTATAVEIRKDTDWQDLIPKVTVDNSGAVTSVAIADKSGSVVDEFTLPA